MANFTELFTATLNETLAKMVAEAVGKYEVQFVEMQGRIVELENTINDFEREREDVESIVERALENFDVDNAVEEAIGNYDFTSIVSDCVDFESNDFASAVKDVIATALR